MDSTSFIQKVEKKKKKLCGENTFQKLFLRLKCVGVGNGKNFKEENVIFILKVNTYEVIVSEHET